MEWSNFKNMDPDLLVGVVNTAIRDHHATLEELCQSECIDSQELSAHLAQGGYEYMEAAKQFR